MRTFEFIEGSSQKFWTIELDGKKTIVTFGRIGTKGQRKEKKYPSAAAAEAQYQKLIREKLAKGYKETTPPVVTGRAAALLEALEEALHNDPDDLASHAAYADLLSEHGDPRGELIQVQIALEDEALPARQRKNLEKREQQLLASGARSWFGDLTRVLLDEKVYAWERARGHDTCYRFRRGWVEALRLARASSAMLRSLGETPIFTLLRELTIVDEDDPGAEEEEDDERLNLSLLLQAPFLPTLRALQIGPLDDHCHISAPQADKLIAKMSRIEELRLAAHSVKTRKIFALPMPHLRVLIVNHIRDYPLEVLANNKSLRQLEHISFWPHALEPGHERAYITGKGFKALVHSPHLTNLRHLAVYNSDLGDRGCAEMVKSGILARLKVLDLTSGCITDTGAAALAACPAFARLERCVLHRNRLTDEGIEALHATGVEVEAENQYDPDMEEREYLWEGDME
jgi:uncharacterized protein (TIGR02996 family)